MKKKYCLLRRPRPAFGRLTLPTPSLAFLPPFQSSRSFRHPSSQRHRERGRGRGEEERARKGTAAWAEYPACVSVMCGRGPQEGRAPSGKEGGRVGPVSSRCSPSSAVIVVASVLRSAFTAAAATEEEQSHEGQERTDGRTDGRVAVAVERTGARAAGR